MSMMQAEIYDAFIDAGASEPKARAAAEVIAQKPQSDEVATKTDIVRLEGRMDSKIAELKVEMARLEVRLMWNNRISTGIILTAIGVLAIYN